MPDLAKRSRSSAWTVAILMAAPLPILAAPARCPPPNGWTSAYKDATVFRDRKGNGQFDVGEPSRNTCPTGPFAPPKGNGRLLLWSGTELLTEVPNPFLLSATAGAHGIGMFTSLWQALRDSGSKEKTIRKMFGLPNSLSLATYKVQCAALAKPKLLPWVRLEGKLDTLFHLAHSLSVLEAWPIPDSPELLGRRGYTDPLIARLATVLSRRTERPVDLTSAETIEALMAGLSPPTDSDRRRAVARFIGRINVGFHQEETKRLAALTLMRGEAAGLVANGDIAALDQLFSEENIDARLLNASSDDASFVSTGSDTGWGDQVKFEPEFF